MPDTQPGVGMLSKTHPTRNTTRAHGTVREAIAAARSWVNDHAGANPDLVCAYLAGSLNRMDPDAPVPEGSDVDIHIIQSRRGTWVPAEEVDGLLLQCTVQDIDLSVPDAVLAHPFEAHPLLFGAVLSDPRGSLASVRATAVPDFSNPRWVQARCEGAIASAHEWLGMIRPDDPTGVDGAVPLVAWATSSMAACLANARQREPGGRKCLLMARDVLQDTGRMDLYERLLALLGVAEFTEDQVRRYHAESLHLFDQALQVHRTFVPGDTLLRPFYRTNIRAGADEILKAGFHREAMWRIQRTYYTACKVLIADAPNGERPQYRAMLDALRSDLDLLTGEQVQERLRSAKALAEETWAVALGMISP